MRTKSGVDKIIGRLVGCIKLETGRYVNGSSKSLGKFRSTA